jgi:NADH-quinone oxidoreductase subunit G
MVQFNLNNSFVVVEKKASIISNLKYLGHFLPRFCFHDNLPVAGNCRACLVELSGSEKPVAACVTEIEQNFNV